MVFDYRLSCLFVVYVCISHIRVCLHLPARPPAACKELGILEKIQKLSKSTEFFTKEEGAVTFQGGSCSFSFPYKGVDATIEIYQVVNSVFADRRAELDASRRAGLERPF